MHPSRRLAPVLNHSFWRRLGDRRHIKMNEQISRIKVKLSNGSILLGTDGCGMDWRLIVTGPDRGIPWMISGEGIQPVCPKRTFLQCNEDWLDGLDSFYGFPDTKA